MVLADGCFDRLHVGHIRYLQAAATYGRLCVNLAPDAVIVAKGRTPFQSQSERAEMIVAVGCVDRVTQYPSLSEAILRLAPDVLVKGRDWRDHLPADVLKACQTMGTRIVYTDTQTRTSSERLAG